MFTNVLFQTALPVPLHSGATDVVAGDFNGDGNTDLFIPTANFTNSGSTSPLLFYMGDGEGDFVNDTAALFGSTTPVGVGAGRVVSGDFNGDGKPDLFVVDEGPDTAPFPGGQNELLLSTASGYTIAIGNLPQAQVFNHGATIGDVNDDGNLDIVVFRLNTSLQLLEGDGHGGFVSVPSALPVAFQSSAPGVPGSTWGALVDVNGDGWPDLIVGTWSNSTAPTQVFLNDGHGSFANATPIALPKVGLVGETVLQVQSADLNGDDIPDLVVSVTDGGPSNGNDFYNVAYLQILIGDGTGHFRDETQLRLPQSTAESSTTTWREYVSIYDVDGDGFKDIVATDQRDGGVTDVFLNNGDGTFRQASGTLPGDAVPLYHNGSSVPYAFAGTINFSQLEVVANDLPQTEIAAAMQNVLHASPLGSAMLTAVASGMESLGAALQALPDAALSTTSVATLAYQFFTGRTPSVAGLDYLVSPTGPNPNNLNSAYYAGFSTLNRYINFASNLGKVGEGAAAFQAAYAGLSLADATSKAYAAIFGSTPTADKVNHLLHDLVPNGLGGTYEREDYFASYGLDGLTGQGTKAAMVGWLLGTAASSDIGTLQTANLAYLEDVATGKASGSVDLVGTYHGTPYTGP